MPKKPQMFRFRDRLPRNGEGKAPRADLSGSVGQDGVARVYLYDVIDSWGGYWGVSAGEFAAALDAIGNDVSEIQLHINSPGGEVYEAIAIKNLLAAHPARVVAVVDGLAASAASFIAAAADETIMGENTELMIHDALGMAYGNAADFHAWADELSRVSDNIASIYANRSGGTPAEWRAVMVEERWYSAQEAVDAGLADRVGMEPADESDDQVAARVKIGLKAIGAKHTARAEAPAPTEPAAPVDEDAEHSSEDVDDLDAVAELAAMQSRHMARAHAMRARAQRA